MQTDLFGNKRYKVNLHAHTTLSDGKKTPAEVLQFYRANGYDAIVLTDHWFYGEGEETHDFTILSGMECNVGGSDSLDGVYHIVCAGSRYAPAVKPNMPVQKVVDAIRAAGGLAILAHPAWSLNTPEEILKLKGLSAVEIYNTVSGVHMSRRADSSLIVDMLATRGCYLPLIAADDAHYYDNDAGENWIMVRAEDNAREYLLPAIRKGDFYATQGPEIHLARDGNEFVVTSSPVQEIIFHSNLVWNHRVFEGDGITNARYTPRPNERYIRAEIVDRDGKRAWSQIIPV